MLAEYQRMTSEDMKSACLWEDIFTRFWLKGCLDLKEKLAFELQRKIRNRFSISAFYNFIFWQCFCCECWRIIVGMAYVHKTEGREETSDSCVLWSLHTIFLFCSFVALL